MAHKNKEVSNSKTGMNVKFLQTAADTNGALLEIEATYQPHSKEPLPHFHPNQDEVYSIISGEFTARIHGGLKILKAGDTLHIPRNTVHSAWNNTDSITVMNWKTQPAMNTEHLMETVAGLAADGKTDENGVPGLLHKLVLAIEFRNTFRAIKPPVFVQNILFAVLTPVLNLSGYKDSYKKYRD